MKQRVLSILLSSILCLGLSTSVLALNWDTGSITSDNQEYYFPPESTWMDKLSISGIVSKGAFDPQDGSFIAQMVYYCTDPTRITLLTEADVNLGGSMQTVSITEDGTILYGGQVEPAWKNSIPDPDFGEINGPGTYWDLSEGVYYMWSVKRSEELFIVVGDPDNAFALTMIDEQVVYLSKPTIRSTEEGGDEAPPYTLHHVSPDTTITLPEDAVYSYKISAFHDIPGQADQEEVTCQFAPGDTVSFRDLQGNAAGSYDCYVVDTDNWITVFNFRVIVDEEQSADTAPGIQTEQDQTDMIPPATQTAQGQFADVPSDMYYYTPVSWAIEKGITNGTSATTFSPDQTCSQAHILTFLWRAAWCPEPKGSNVFTPADVVDSQYYYKALLWAYENGIINDTGLAPNSPCSRSDVVTYLWRLSGQPAGGNNLFNDVAADAAYAKAVAWAVEEGITNGTSATTFSPAETCTRGQIVTFLYRYFIG